jgi:hypothetical protein
MCDRITVASAAEQLGMTEQAIRVLMQRKKLPIGQVIDHGGKKEYLIWQSRVDAFKAS